MSINLSNYLKSGVLSISSGGTGATSAAAALTALGALPLSGGTLSSCTVDGTNGVGYINIPQNSQSSSYTLVAADAGRHIFHPSTDASARTFTIPANSSVAYPIGTELTVINQYGAGTITLTSTDTLRLITTGTTGDTSVIAGNKAQLIKVTSTEWLVSGATYVPPTVPGAPTIGTATATAYNTATVSYTAPANTGGVTITSYTATSSPGGITGTLSTAGSGTITVSGLSASTSYTFTVTATNSIGTSAASSASNGITTPAVPGPTVPGAPTIGTATATGGTTATVAYTAPANTGGVTITSYTATSSPGGITGTLSTAGDGTITVNGLSASTLYTFTVTATNSIGTSAASSASNGITTPAGLSPTTIGQTYGGGFYAGKINVSGTQYYLIVAPKASGENSSRTWGTYGATTGITSVIDGPINSSSLAVLGAAYQAAVYCEGLTIGGYSDWYLPAKNELEVLYYFLKPTTTANNTAWGSNANAVSPEPINTNYTSGSPAQTSAGIGFRTGETDAFASDFYWSSTEYNAGYAWIQNFPNGSQFYASYGKSESHYVRAVRRIAVTGPTVGQAYGGGFYAGKINVSGTQYYLIVAPKASGENSSRTWGTYGATTGITSVIDGPTNSSSLAALGAAYQAAVYCEGLTIGGYSDWYLPAKNELEVLYYFLKPTTGANDTSSGSNANAVSPEPINTNYTSGSPAQISAGIGFRTGETDAFASAYYWSSTEPNAGNAWSQAFYSGYQTGNNKVEGQYVRAVRRIAV